MALLALIPNDFYTAEAGFEAVLEACSAENVKTIEIAYLWGKSILDLDKDEVQRLHQALDARGISIGSIQTQIMKVFPRGARLAKPGSGNMHRDHEFNVSRIDAAIDMAREFDASYIITYSYFTHLNKRPEDELWKDMLADYEILIDKCKRAGKIMVVECEGDTLVRDAATYRKLFDHFDSPHLKANLDLANFTGHAGDFTREDFDLLAGDVAYFHVKDRVASKSVLGKLPVIGQFFRSKPAVFGEGDVPWRRVLPWFIERGYDGMLSVEPHVHGKDKFEKAVACVKNLKRMLDELGIPWQ